MPEAPKAPSPFGEKEPGKQDKAGKSQGEKEEPKDAKSESENKGNEPEQSSLAEAFQRVTSTTEKLVKALRAKV